MKAEQKVDDLSKEVRFELKDIYKVIANFKANVGILNDTVEKLNIYTHDRIHDLLNTDKGIELTLVQIQERMNMFDDFKKSVNDMSTDIRKKVIDFVFRICSGGTLIIIGMLLKGHLSF
jgi:hypothetical protein